jgi:hypothetical protein
MTMTLRLLATPLVAATLLLSTLGCSKKEDAQPTTTSTGSYKLDGAARNCQTKAYVSSSSSGGLTYDYLEVDLTTTPAPASGAEVLKLYYQKSGGQPANAYVLNGIELSAKGSTVSFANNVSTLNTTSGNGYSGTFFATAIRSTTPPPYTTISDGVFTDARP